MTESPERTCQGCGGTLPPNKAPGQPRKWCSERCRRNQYAGTCVDCGAPTNGHDGPGKAPERCVPCANVRIAAARLTWTRERIVAAINAWAAIYGEPPACVDWNPYLARALGDESRANRFEAALGHWPSFRTVYDRFGSWNEAIQIAGYEPRLPHGGGDNVFRRRQYRGREAA